MKKESLKEKQTRVRTILRLLKKTYPDARCALDFSSPFELLAATVLSAQCTDKRVNLVTPALFQRYRTIADYAAAREADLCDIIRSTGFYQNKGRNIIGAAKKVMAEFNGEVPRTLDELVTLPGVGRKTANVILGNAFDVPGVTVDTHMIRINRLLGLTQHTDPVKIEFDLMEIIPRKDWTLYSHLIIHHGRARCIARRPDCTHCEIRKYCPSANLFLKDKGIKNGR